MSEKWTEGPWEYVPGTLVGCDTVAACYIPNRSGAAVLLAGEKAEPNARLIAAAPDLAEHVGLSIGALQLLRMAVKAGESQETILFRIDDMEREAEAALSKARGSE